MPTAKKKREFRHIDGVSVIPDVETVSDTTFRYRLDVVRDDVVSADAIACVVMQNPSVANGTESDATMKKLETAIFLKSYPAAFDRVKKLIVVNQFAKVQTAGFRGNADEIGPRNDDAIKCAFNEADIIIIGWGCSNPFYRRQYEILRQIASLQNKVLLKTHKHPSLAAYEGFFEPLVIEHDLSMLAKRLGSKAHGPTGTNC
jgi:hypothetical protein